MQGGVSPKFSEFWDLLTPSVTCNSTLLLKRLIVTGRGISLFSKLAFLEEISSGEVVWRPIEEPNINALTVGIVVPSQRPLSKVTLEFARGVAHRIKRLELSLLDA